MSKVQMQSMTFLEGNNKEINIVTQIYPDADSASIFVVRENIINILSPLQKKEMADKISILINKLESI